MLFQQKHSLHKQGCSKGPNAAGRKSGITGNFQINQCCTNTSTFTSLLVRDRIRIVIGFLSSYFFLDSEQYCKFQGFLHQVPAFPCRFPLSWWVSKSYPCSHHIHLAIWILIFKSQDNEAWSVWSRYRWKCFMTLMIVGNSFWVLV